VKIILLTYGLKLIHDSSPIACWMPQPESLECYPTCVLPSVFDKFDLQFRFKMLAQEYMKDFPHANIRETTSMTLNE